VRTTKEIAVSDRAYVHPLDLSGRTAIVTGGNRGIGLGMAKGLVAAGCGVAIWARDRERNAAALAECARGPGRAEAFACDVTDAASIERALDATAASFGAIDGLFANAGVGGGGRVPFLEQADEAWARMLEVNLMGTKRTAAAVLSRMVEQSRGGRPGGRVVATSSVAVHKGTAFNQHYAATKSAIVSLVRGIAVEFARYGITANAILPGYARTEMIDDLVGNERFLKAIEPRLPLRRLATIDDFAGIAVYLMSDLSGYHTGDAITIDGGFLVA
jgi:NAD(P)-dependent dehydrogenase (short-subunit alcohol dehydrogenase family)